MTRTEKLLLAAAAASLLAAVACGSADSTFPMNDKAGAADVDASPSNPTQFGADSGTTGNGGTDAGGGVAQAGSVVLVHASRNLPAFRVCFGDRTQTLPLPDDKIMPNANVVGVDVGAAVHLGQLDQKTPGASTIDASVPVFDAGPDAAAQDAGSGPSTLYIIEEKFARPFFPQGSDASSWPSCGVLVPVLKSNGYEGHGLYTRTGPSVTPSATSAVFVIITGCLPDPTLSAAECGAGYDKSTGNLTYQTLFVPSVAGSGFQYEGVSMSPAVADSSTLTYSDSTGTKAMPLVLSTTKVSATQSSTLPPDDPAYATASFALAAPDATSLLTQPLADIQALSSPRDLPSTFFGLRSTFVLFAIGDPKASGAHALHLLAVPVADPALIGDSGAP